MKRTHLDERDIRLFLLLDALLEHGSVTRAAERLGVTQSAVSHGLRALRVRLGDPLFVRTARGMVPTPRALSLRPALQSGLAELERVLTGDAVFAPATSSRRFTVATHDDMIFTVMPDLIARLRRDAPNVDVGFEEIGPDLSDRLANGQIDVLMARAVIEPGLRLAGDLVRTHVATDPLTCLLRADHPALTAPLTREVYLALPHIAVRWDGDADPVEDALQGLGTRRIAVTVQSFPAAAWFVAGSDMIATLPEAVATRAARRLDVVMRAPPVPLSSSRSYLWWHRRFQHEPGHAWWRKLLIEACKADR